MSTKRRKSHGVFKSSEDMGGGFGGRMVPSSGDSIGSGIVRGTEAVTARPPSRQASQAQSTGVAPTAISRSMAAVSPSSMGNFASRSVPSSGNGIGSGIVRGTEPTSAAPVARTSRRTGTASPMMGTPAAAVNASRKPGARAAAPANFITPISAPATGTPQATLPGEKRLEKSYSAGRAWNDPMAHGMAGGHAQGRSNCKF